jgi:hypothetical protein
MKNLLFTPLALLLLLAACKSTQKLYDQGSYDRAVYSALDDLKKNGSNPVALNVLPKAYQDAARGYLDNIAAAKLGTVSEQKLATLYRDYAALQNMYHAIQATPAALGVVSPTNYATELNDAAEQAADLNYNHGLALLQRGDRISAQQAYGYFKATESYVSGYLDVEEKKAEAYNLAVINVVVDKFDQRFGFYNVNGNYFQSDLIRNLNNIGRGHYYNFYGINEPQAQELKVDQYLDINVYDISFGQLASNEYSYNVSRDITEKDDHDPKLSRTTTVTATVYVTRRIIDSRAMMDYRITDAVSRRIITYDRVPAQFTWERQTGSYKGDSRALGDKDWAILRGAFDRQPGYDELYRELTNRMMNEFNSRMRNIYGR